MPAADHMMNLMLTYRSERPGFRVRTYLAELEDIA